MNTSNKLDLLAIRNATFIRELDYHAEIDSTNRRAMELAKTDPRTPLLVVAARQSAGRGRGANQWWSSDGALTFTVLMDLPVVVPEQLSSFSLTAGLAVCQALERFVPNADLALKWPNDVYLNGKKACGVLIENPNAAGSRLAIGIGINVNNSLRHGPRELSASATSLLDEADSDFALTTVLIECLNQLEARSLDHVLAREALLDQWRAYCLLTGREVTVNVQGSEITGQCWGVDEAGALLVDDGTKMQKLIAGVVSRF